MWLCMWECGGGGGGGETLISRILMEQVRRDGECECV